MRVIIEPTNEQGSAWAAAHIARRINEHAKSTDRPLVWVCPVAPLLLGTYRKLIEMCKAGQVSFANVITFNMDEIYVGIPKDHPGGLPLRSCGTTFSATSTSSPKT